MNCEEKMKKIVRVLDDKKALDIKVLKISNLTVLADYFVICSATSTTAVRALSDYVEEETEKCGEPIPQKEGKDGFNWLLMDYGDVIVHIFYQQTREFYDLEKLWSDAEAVDISEIVSVNQ